MFVEIKKDGFYYGNKIIEDLSLYMNYEVEVEEGVTLETLFDNLMAYDIDTLNIIFNPYIRGFRIDKYYDQMQKESESESQLIKLEVNWGVDYIEYESDDGEKLKELDIYPNVNGVSKDNEYYGISLTNINDLKHLILSIDYSLKIIDYYKDTKNPTEILSAVRVMTFYEYVGCILNEISFHGYAEHKEDILQGLEETAYNIDNGIEELIDGEKFMLEMLERSLENYVKEENYEEAAKLKKEIEKIKKQKGNDEKK